MARIKAWMLEHGAAVLVENLAPGASAAELGEAERLLGMTLPSELAALWSVHHGQLAEQNGFVEHMDLLGAQAAFAEADSVKLFVEFLRQHPKDWKAAGVTEAEVRSNRWIAFAGRGYADLLVISAESGRVFWCGKDAPTVQLRAPSLTAWLEQYAAAVAADDYELDEGFGEVFLSLRDRAREVVEAANEAKATVYEAWRRETPIVEQLRQALEKKNEDLCRDIVEDAAKRSQLGEAVELLFSKSRDPSLLATSLQYVLSQVTLTKQQWALVAKGGEALGNNAIRDQALARAR
ncbi:MAG: SMI1/KNR4 family protein [Archangium sp.]|nr:SMI1/KNR4 family protein [Archangium sp.]